MTYVEPKDVVSPKASIAGSVHVLVDKLQGGYSIASLIWEGKPAIGIRWNGNDDHPGNPQSRGLPTWFILPSELDVAILDAIIPTIEGEAFMYARKLLSDIGVKTPLRLKVAKMKLEYWQKYKESAEFVDFTPEDEMEISQMGKEDLGDLCVHITVHGARYMNTFLGLKTRWDRNLLQVGGPSSLKEI